MGNWSQLTSGGGYDFETKQLFGRFNFLKDVVYPLAGLPRYVRHASLDWMVAIHSVCVARTIERVTGSKAEAAGGLLHDLHESIIGDIATPVARAIGYNMVKAVQADIQFALENKLNVPDNLRPINLVHWKVADAAALLVEKQLFHPPEPRAWGVPEPESIWMQTMYDVVLEAMDYNQHRDGGELVFVSEWNRLVSPVGV